MLTMHKLSKRKPEPGPEPLTLSSLSKRKQRTVNTEPVATPLTIHNKKARKTHA